jgi:CheY-like chemotaxis protein
MDPSRVQRYVSIQAGPHVRLSIRDTGSGMSEEVVSKIFEPFFSTKGRGEGTGLGLATVYGIVKQASGAIFVDSRPGEGTEFEVLWPVVTALPEPARPSNGEHPTLGGAERVLLVEDSPGVRSIAARLLTRHGYQVLEASQGEEALRLITEAGHRPHLLLTDVVMPGLSGREVAKRVRAVLPDVRILYMSGYPDSLVTAQGVLIDNVHFVSKPFTAASLLEAVRNALDTPPTPVGPA